MKLRNLVVKPVKLNKRRGTCNSRCGCGTNAGAGA